MAFWFRKKSQPIGQIFELSSKFVLIIAPFGTWKEIQNVSFVSLLYMNINEKKILFGTIQKTLINRKRNEIIAAESSVFFVCLFGKKTKIGDEIDKFESHYTLTL